MKLIQQYIWIVMVHQEGNALITLQKEVKSEYERPTIALALDSKEMKSSTPRHFFCMSMITESPFLYTQHLLRFTLLYLTCERVMVKGFFQRNPRRRRAIHRRIHITLLSFILLQIS